MVSSWLHADRMMTSSLMPDAVCQYQRPCIKQQEAIRFYEIDNACGGIPQSDVSYHVCIHVLFFTGVCRVLFAQTNLVVEFTQAFLQIVD